MRNICTPPGSVVDPDRHHFGGSKPISISNKCKACFPENFNILFKILKIMTPVTYDADEEDKAI
jgi:hypothetical protein